MKKMISDQERYQKIKHVKRTTPYLSMDNVAILLVAPFALIVLPTMVLIAAILINANL